MGECGERCKSQSRKYQLQVRWGELKRPNQDFFSPRFLFLKTDERRQDTGCLMRRDDGQCAHYNMQIIHLWNSVCCTSVRRWIWKPPLLNYYDNWGFFGGRAKLMSMEEGKQSNIQTHHPKMFLSVDVHSDAVILTTITFADTMQMN